MSQSSHVGRKAGAPSHWTKGFRLTMNRSGRGTNSDKAAANHGTIYGAWKRLLSFLLVFKPHSKAQRTITVSCIIFEYKGQQNIIQPAVQSTILVGNIFNFLFFSLLDNIMISSSRGWNYRPLPISLLGYYLRFYYKPLADCRHINLFFFKATRMVLGFHLSFFHLGHGWCWGQTLISH